MAGILSKRLSIPPAQVCQIIKINDPYMSPLVCPNLRTLSFSKRFSEFVVPSLVKTAASSGVSSLTANQIGLPGNVFVVRNDLKDGIWEGYQKNEADEGKFKVLINPVVKKTELVEKFEEEWETCPSLPLIHALCRRRSEVLVKYQDLNGEDQEIPAKGFLARVIQHEIDHLSGILMITTLASEGRIKTTDPKLEPEVEAFKIEIEKRYKDINHLFETNPRARRIILRLKGEKEESIKKIIFTKELNAHFIARFHNALNDGEFEIPDFKDEDYKMFLKTFSKS